MRINLRPFSVITVPAGSIKGFIIRLKMGLLFRGDIINSLHSRKRPAPAALFLDMLSFPTNYDKFSLVTDHDVTSNSLELRAL